MIEVRPISLPQDAKAFIRTWWPIYAQDPHWVPPLVFERVAFFDPAKNPYFRYADIQCFLAFRDGVAVGTIAATVDHEVQRHEPGVGFFGFYEFIDDREVARALADAATAWLRGKGMTVMRGPFNFNTNHEFGLLVDGFDTDPCIANPHNSAYFPGHYDALGFRKAMDWYAYWLEKKPMPARIGQMAERVLKRNPNVQIRAFDPSQFDREVGYFREIYNDAWEDNWGHVYIRDDEFAHAAKGFKPLLDKRLCWFAFVDGECAAASITFSDFNQPVKRANGGLFPFGWVHLGMAMTGLSQPDALRVFVLGVKKKFQHLGLGAPLYVKTWDNGMTLPIRGAEASLILETNTQMRGALEKWLDAKIYKTYRTYERAIPAAD